MQNAAFAARGLDWAYVAVDVPPERLEEAVRGLAALGFAGANVTAPHKLAAAELCDEADAESVNTLLFRDGRVVGASTDAAVLDGLTFERARDRRGRRRRACVRRRNAERARSSRVAASGRPRWQRPMSSSTRPRCVTRCYSSSAQDKPSSTFPTRTPRRRASRATPARRVIDGLEVLVRAGRGVVRALDGLSAPLDVMRNAVRSAP